MLAGAALILALMLPLAFAILGARVPRAPAEESATQRADGTAAEAAGRVDARLALRSLAFWSVTAPSRWRSLSQAGFLVHQIAFLEPTIGRNPAGIAVAITTGMAIVGRLMLGASLSGSTSASPAPFRSQRRRRRWR